MECCVAGGVGGVRAPTLHLELRIVPFRPVGECGMPERCVSGASRNSAGRRYAADLSRRGCCCCWAKRDAGFKVWTSCGSAGARFSTFLESCPTQRTRTVGLIMARAEAENGNHGNEDETSELEAANMGPPIVVKKSPDFWLQLGIFLFTAGFVDAGFSGDWSRMGVLSKHTEEELQIAAVGVAPLAVTLIWSISQRKNLS